MDFLQQCKRVVGIGCKEGLASKKSLVLSLKSEILRWLLPFLCICGLHQQRKMFYITIKNSFWFRILLTKILPSSRFSGYNQRSSCCCINNKKLNSNIKNIKRIQWKKKKAPYILSIWHKWIPSLAVLLDCFPYYGATRDVE
jgi:hypothetical protein